MRITHTSEGISVAATDATIEQILSAIGHELGIRIFSRETASTRISFEIHDVPLSVMLNSLLPDPGFLLIYSEPWPGSLRDSPNKLWLLGGEDTLSRQELWIRDEPELPDIGDPIAVIDEAILSAGGNEAASFSALATIALSHADTATREEAVFAIGESTHPDRFQILLQTLGDSSADVRFAAVSGLAATDADAITGLLQAVGDEDPGVRDEAILILEELGCHSSASKELSSERTRC